jgi:diguanylate cyclase (GGDEF)-like protein/PAS domain S-box-containing protein
MSPDTSSVKEPSPRPADAAARQVALPSLPPAGLGESRTALLARAGIALGTSMDGTAVARTVARLAVPDLADICIIDAGPSDGPVTRVAVTHRDAAVEASLRAALGETGPVAGSPQRLALDSGQAQIGRTEDAGTLWETWVGAGAAAELLGGLGVRAYLVLPLQARQQTLGVMTLLSTDRRAYAADDFAAAAELARRTSTALDNALLYETAERARAEIESAEAQFERLLEGLRESEDRYRTLFSESRDAVYVTEADGRFIDVNPAALELFGYSRQEMLNLNARQLYAQPADRERFRAEIERTGSVREFELLLRTKTGALRDCLLSSIVRRSPSGAVLGYQGIIHDVTERKRAEAQLMESEHFTRTIITSVQQGIIVYDRSLRYQLWNRFMEQLTGLGAAEVLGRHALDLFPHLEEHGIDELLDRALRGETVQAPDIPFAVSATGRSGWVSSVYSPHRSRSGEIMGVVGIIHDITERKRAEEQLVHNAFHDALTDLPNRALFMDRLERLLRHSERHPEYVFGVAFLDLDRFKVVNDSLGHLRGDELLVALARRLEGCIRQGDTVARIGGDEFAVLLDDVQDVRDATRVAERILAELGQPFHLAGTDVFTMASIGIALSSTGYEHPEEILRDADTAMYRAKLDGRWRYEVFDRNMHDRVVQTLQVETDLRRAVERSELRLHYQPIVGLDSGHIAGFEALVRWQHPTRGMVAPDDFVPLAEETGMIVPIGLWVLEEACRQMNVWLHRYPQHPGMSVSVNLSTKQFMQPDLLQQIDGVLDRTGLPAEALKLEITESAVVQHEEAVTATLVALRARGIQLCIDDFGTGYSSLSYLHAFPVDMLKIDRSFINQIGFTGSNPRLVESIVALSRSLGMETVAEGVETAEQLAFLRGLGPRFGQGFLFSRALPAAEAEAFLERNPVW